ncbi:hypothetical protein [Pseudodesulfovibrio portus]|uniref:Peptidase U32 n=1 Tax=Pseudodesulfovibrio portus TaxID=231439 RepID=A0ABN6RSQ0_9BACT|nr:hypothetical protein [Pseudodesulfovibrio portus]BDQ34119.1 hypothetical protein JCM14722_16610 [Pseudodesulfovibrio portus]
MLLDVPFIAEGGYPAFLADRLDRVRSVHFSLSSPLLQDARQRLAEGDTARIIKELNRLDGVRRYVLMNGRLHDPARYFDTRGLDRTADLLRRLLDEAGLHGVIFADGYFLTALSDRCPDVADRLEGVPSINCMLDTPTKVFATLAMIGETGFRLPSRLVLDRSLNRDANRLEAVAGEIRRVHPDIELLLMANEGCLYQCPYKAAHDAHISLVNEGLCPERTFAMNRDFGCVRRMLAEPGAMLASPFIRPEDLARFEGLADGVKVCGRNRGTDFLMRAVTAYSEERHDGNLLDIMDAMGDLSDHVHIPNPALPPDFADRVTACDKRCGACGWCAGVMDRIATRTAPGLADLSG